MPSRADVRAALARHQRVEIPALPGRTNHLASGVLVPLRFDDADVTCILTARTPHLRAHGGEVSFPGGRPDEEDADLEATAIREAREELAIEVVEVLGRLSSIPLYTSDYRLHPYVAAIADGPLVPNPDEVAEVLPVSLRELLGRPHFDAIAWNIRGVEGMTPVFEHGEHLVYGATSHTLLELLTVVAPLFGVPLPPMKTGRFEWEEVLRHQTGR